jgi:hypothetical protein
VRQCQKLKFADQIPPPLLQELALDIFFSQVVLLDPMPNVTAAAPAGCSPCAVTPARSSRGRSSLSGVAKGTSTPSSWFHPLASYHDDAVA